MFVVFLLIVMSCHLWLISVFLVCFSFAMYIISSFMISASFYWIGILATFSLFEFCENVCYCWCKSCNVILVGISSGFLLMCVVTLIWPLQGQWYHLSQNWIHPKFWCTAKCITNINYFSQNIPTSIWWLLQRKSFIDQPRVVM